MAVKKNMVETGGGPPPFFPSADLPGIEEKVFKLSVAISGNNDIPKTEILFEFETETSHDIVNLSNTKHIGKRKYPRVH